MRIERALHPAGYNFEAGIGQFTKGWSGDEDDVTTTSLDRGNNTYIIDGSFGAQSPGLSFASDSPRLARL